MSQNDLSLANASGAAFRADANSAVQALGSQQSGTSAPGTTYPLQRWADTTEHVMRQRNEGNSAWRIVGTLDTDLTPIKTGAYTVALRDVTKLIMADATSAGFTVTLPAASSAGDGFRVEVENTGTGGNAVTLDGNASETINGQATLQLRDGERAMLVCDGANWLAVIAGPLNNLKASAAPTVTDDNTKGYRIGSTWIHSGAVYRCLSAATGAANWLNTSTAGLSPVASYDLTNSGANDLAQLDVPLEIGYYYIGRLRDMSGTGASWVPSLRFQTAGGSVRTGASDYNHSSTTGSTGGTTNDSDDRIELSETSIAAAAGAFEATFEIRSPRNSSVRTKVLSIGMEVDVNKSRAHWVGGHVQTAEDNDVVRLLISSGTMDGGTLDIFRIQEVP